MTSELLVALLSLTGTLVGSISGILMANKLVMYRIEQLEKKVDKHNCLVERTFALERDMKMVLKDVDELKEDIKHD